MGKKEAGEWKKKAMELAKREGGEKEEEMGVWRRDSAENRHAPTRKMRASLWVGV